MNYYPFHIGDYVSATRHLSWDEDAAFRRLLDAYYIKEGPLPLELRAVFRLVVAASQEQREAVETVLREFFVETADGWANKRADAELIAMREKQQKQRDRANARWNKPRTAHGNAASCGSDAAASKTDAGAMPPTPTPTPTPTPIEEREPPTPTGGEEPPALPVKTEDPTQDSAMSVGDAGEGASPAKVPPAPPPAPLVPKPEPAEPEGFVRFWQAWPAGTRKGGRAQCLGIWRRKGFERQSDAIVAHVKAMADSSEWRKQGGEFVPLASTYLNGTRWDGADSEGTDAERGVFAGAV